MNDSVADRDTNSSLKGYRCRKPLVSRGHLQWTMEGWVGSVLGATVWMLLFAVTLALDGRFGLACVPATAAVSIGTLSRILWNRRGHVFPFTAYIILLSWIALMNPVVLACLLFNSDPPAGSNLSGDPIRNLVVGSIVAPSLILLFHYLERRSLSHRSSGREGH